MNQQEQKKTNTNSSVIPDGSGGTVACPALMTEDELIKFLRIPEITTSKNHHNVIENLKQTRDLPRVHICNRVLFPLEAVMDWIEKETKNA